jgi:hypothetical protein
VPLHLGNAGADQSRLGVTTSRSKPPHDRSAVRPEADTLNQTVRSRFTPPERDPFKPAPLRGSCNSLNYRAFNIRTKMAVVRLPRRKWAERDEKRPDTGPQASPHGSDNLPGVAAVCGFPTADQERKKNVPTGRLGGAKAIRTQGSEGEAPTGRRAGRVPSLSLYACTKGQRTRPRSYPVSAGFRTGDMPV